MSTSELASHKRQKIEDGYGAAFHRVYSISIPATHEQAQVAMHELQMDLNKFSPQLMAKFEKVTGAADKMRIEDEFQIHITGPWNGPVRVAKVSETAFRFVTLKGHMEADEINFEIKKESDSTIIFEIESLARSRDVLVDIVYDKLPIAKLAQTEMWTLFCTAFSERLSETKPNEVVIVTERQDQETGQWKKL